jgi:putative ABC transport system permease protein
MDLQITPILRALRRHKAGTVLIALQIALTLAIVCNALFIIQQRVAHLSRGTGIIESDLIAVNSRFVGEEKDLIPKQRTDLAAIRDMPDVLDAYSTNSYPLRGGGWSMGATLTPDAKKASKQTTIYFVDDHAMATLGFHLVAGRNFNASEITTLDPKTSLAPAVTIITKSLADKLYPDGSALGKIVYLDNTKPSTIIGLIDRLQVPWIGGFSKDFDDSSSLVPAQLVSASNTYMIRTKPGRQAAVMAVIAKRLYDVNRLRIIPEDTGIRSFAQVRAKAYESDRGMAIMMSVVCAVLLGVTAAGIVGLTSFWVGQRRKQIGVRRALGARKRDILHYFLTENLLIGLAGVIVGSMLAVGLSVWMQTQFEMERMSVVYVAVGVVLLLLLGQGAVLAPAIRASRVSPVEAQRSV